MSEIYSKRGVWYIKAPGQDIQVFETELAAKESLGYKEPVEEDCCEDKEDCFEGKEDCSKGKEDE